MRVPILIGVHGFCVGAGLNLITGGDIRFCTEDAKFSLKEVDIGIAADIGAFPRLPLIMSNESFIREISYTGRPISAQEAEKYGLVSRVFKNQEEMILGLKGLAEEISCKSPVAIYSLKRVMNRTKFGGMEEVLEYVAMNNMAMTFTNDVGEAISANLAKGKGTFAKL